LEAVIQQQNDIIRPAAAVRPAATNDRNAAEAGIPGPLWEE